MKSFKSVSFLIIGFICCLSFFQNVDSHPLQTILSRQKRISDQRLAELQTLLTLSRMGGTMVTVPIAFGKVDPMKLGRKRRTINPNVPEWYFNKESPDEFSLLSKILNLSANRLPE